MRQRASVLAILSLLLGFASISTDFYLPAMPTMAKTLNTSSGTIAFTVTGYLIGFSLGQLFWGPVSDKLGRRAPMAGGVVLFIIGSAGCALSNSGGALVAFRLVQAHGATPGVVLARAMVRDLYEGAKAAQMLSTLMLVMAIAPLVGPFLGGQILALAGWRAIFWTLAVVGLGTFVAVLTLPETLSPERRDSNAIHHALSGYRHLVTQRRLMAFASAGGFFFAGIFAYIAGSPFAYISYHHIPAQAYGFLFGAGIAGIMVANLSNARLVLRVGVEKMLVTGTAVAAAAGLILALDARSNLGGVLGLAVPLFFFVSMTGWIVANSVAGALSGFPQRAGAASALVGAVQYGAGVVGSGLVGALADGTPWPMAAIVAISGLGAMLSTRLL